MSDVTGSCVSADARRKDLAIGELNGVAQATDEMQSVMEFRPVGQLHQHAVSIRR